MMKKGRMLLKHKCEKLKMELAPSFLLKWNTDRTDVFFAFEFFETANIPPLFKRWSGGMFRM